MIDEHYITGGMDLDSSDHTIPPGFYRRARNVIIRGLSGGKLRPESAPSARFVPNPLIDDETKTVGLKYDPVNQRLFVFYWRTIDAGFSLGSIFVYYTLTGVWQRILQDGGGQSDKGALGITAELITSIQIIYREQVDGDLLLYIDGFGVPRCINVTQYLTAPPAFTKRTFLDLAQGPPRMVPKCCYENDFTVFVNNLKNALFQFRYRFVFSDGRKSVYSSGSEVPLPNVRFGFENTDITNNYNARIAVYVSTGDTNVTKIEIVGKQTTDLGKGTSGASTPIADYFLIKSLTKAELGIADNDVYKFLFYNDGVYTPIDIDEQDQLQDYVPKKSNCMELLNGNTPVLGGNTEGFDKHKVNMAVTSSNESQWTRCTFNGALFFAAQSGVDSYGKAGDDIKIILTGTAANNAVSGNPEIFYQIFPGPTQIVFTGNEQFIIQYAIADAASIFQYVLPTNVPPTYAIVDILNGIAAAASGDGFSTSVDPTTNTLTINRSGAQLFSAQVYTQTLVTTGQYQSASLNTHFAFPNQSAEDFAIQYFDQQGRTNGASIAVDSQITTPQDVTGSTIPLIQLLIQSRPPLWAYYYSIVRAQNLTYAKALYWVCNQTFNNVDLDTGINYAYIGITNMPLYNKNIEASTPVVSYEFSPGDRIRFDIRYPGSTESIPSNLQPYDYEIISVAQNPLLNGVPQKGTFIKIVYPAADATPFNFDFPNPVGFPGITNANYFNFQNYKIFIYSYEKHATNAGSELYYEFGKMYAVGLPGTVNSYHIAPEQSQPSDLSSPAIIRVDDGNFFHRFRNVPAGASYYIPAGNNAFSNQYATLTVTPLNGDVLVPGQYLIGHQNGFAAALGITNYPGPTDINALYWNQSGAATTIRVHGNVDLHTSADTFTSIVLKIVTSTNVIIVPLVTRFALPLPETIQSYNIPFDGYASIPPNAKCWILGQNGNGNGLGNITLHWGVFTIQLDVSLNIIIPITEESYSDKYQIVTNSNSRPTVFDEQAKEQYFSTQYRWSLPDILNTNINNINRFFYTNSDEIDRAFGDLMRMRVRGRELRFFQKRRCGRTDIYARFLKQNNGQDVVATTNDIISKNNVEYFEGEFGIGNQPSSLCSSGYADYFVDPVKGYFIRLSLDGLITISDKYRIQTYAGVETTKYLNNYNYPWGGIAAIVGVYNFTEDRESEALFVLQSGGIVLPDSSVISTAGETVAFNEAGNRWTSFYDFAPDNAVCCENFLFTFFNARMYIHDSLTPPCNYYGTQYKPSITFVKNIEALVKKSWISIAQVSNVPWLSSLIYTESLTYPGQRQESKLFIAQFKYLEGQWHASFLRDIHSIGGIGYGDKLKGTFLVIQLEPADGSVFAYISSAAVKFIISAQLVR